MVRATACVSLCSPSTKAVDGESATRRRPLVVLGEIAYMRAIGTRVNIRTPKIQTNIDHRLCQTRFHGGISPTSLSQGEPVALCLLMMWPRVITTPWMSPFSTLSVSIAFLSLDKCARLGGNHHARSICLLIRRAHRCARYFTRSLYPHVVIPYQIEEDLPAAGR